MESCDGTVIVKTAAGTLKRAVKCLCPLSIDTNNNTKLYVCHPRIINSCIDINVNAIRCKLRLIVDPLNGGTMLR